ncbi:MAG TPA: LysR family transcriptional regulator [Rickettsiales bacterium]|nr:LysR family transcriptional regulator [Rickettsiales bacterium]
MFKEKDFYYRKARLTQVRGFCAVVQSNCSITEASEKIHLEPCTLSKQISALERDLGIELIDRTHLKKLKLTEGGSLFYNEAVKYINGIDGLFKNFNEHLRNFNNTHVSIALHQTAATYIFPPILEKMIALEQFKDLKVDIYSIPKDEAIEKLINKEINLAFYINAPKEKLPVGVETIKSMPSHVSLVFNKHHPLAEQQEITKEDLEKYKFLRRNVETKTYSNVYGRFNADTSNIRTINTSFETNLEIIKRTDNISTVPELFLQNNYLNNLGIESRNIDHLIDKAFFNVMLLKDNLLTEPMSWIIGEFKKLVSK